MENGGQRRVAVVGGGAWGLALAAAAARAESDVVLVSRRPLDHAPGVRVVKALEEAARHARLLILAVPSSVSRAVARELGEHIDGSHYVVHGVRGLVSDESDEDLYTISDVLREETPVRRTGALGGPALAQDLLAGRPSVVVVGSRYPEVTEAATAALGSPTLRVYPTNDLKGLEWASALVGCLTIAIGYAQAMNTSAGLVAALISRSVGEASRIAAAAGGDAQTLLGLAGYGDLLASIAQGDRPEIIVGQALAKGLAPAEAAKAAELRVEALELIPRVARWTEAAGVRSPIFHALANGVVGGKSANTILHELMTLPIEHRA
ncbi:MAG: NAD(P)-binding domain-containing protein [Labilithrix sp.]|nr:NAD(P)-binding domain-containing protein [Labilithrix sp.]MCW5812052.1 NAD(P)-binding domain-containing protein [Labilithrix sp.]